MNWDTVRKNLKIPIQIEREKAHPALRLPRQIGLIVPFTEHEWYKNLIRLLKDYAEKYGIGLQVIDADQNVRDEVDLRRRQIARKAATLIKAGDVVLVDGGPISQYLAEELKQKKEITVITNSVTVFRYAEPHAGYHSYLHRRGGAVQHPGDGWPDCRRST